VSYVANFVPKCGKPASRAEPGWLKLFNGNELGEYKILGASLLENCYVVAESKKMNMAKPKIKFVAVLSYLIV